MQQEMSATMTLGECNTCTTICVMSDVTMTCDAMYMYRDEVKYKYNVYIHTYNTNLHNTSASTRNVLVANIGFTMITNSIILRLESLQRPDPVTPPGSSSVLLFRPSQR